MLDELAQHGFRWYDVEDAATIGAWLRSPDPELIEHNATVARRFSLARLQARLRSLLADRGWL